MAKCNACAKLMQKFDAGVTCIQCSKLYHGEFVNIARGTRVARETFVCPDCLAKQRKRNNLNTPIKHSHAEGVVAASVHIVKPGARIIPNSLANTTSGTVEEAILPLAPPLLATAVAEALSPAIPSNVGDEVRGLRREITELRVFIEKCLCHLADVGEKLDSLDRHLSGVKERNSRAEAQLEQVEELSAELNTKITLSSTMELPGTEKASVPHKQRTRYNGRVKKRAWEEGSGGEEKRRRDAAGEAFERVKKRKVAVLLGYSGADYFGMQRNPGVNTVEEELCGALLRAGYVTSDVFAQMQQVDFQRAARTDKGVSAARQVVSLKLPEDATVEKINETLPPCIRVFGIKRVTKGFNSKTQCDARTYTYTLPTFAFEPDAASPEQQRAYRASRSKLDAVDDVLSVYRGTKNYHNFTSKKDHHDPSCLRFMMSFKVDKVFVDSDVEFAVLKVKGQSFMLHQIRKMVGAMLAVVRGLTPAATLQRALSAASVALPTAPGLGLLLDQVHYDRYDTRYGKDGIHSTLEWSELDPTVEDFKMKYILPNVIRTELADNSMASWLETLPRHSYEPRDDDCESTGHCAERSELGARESVPPNNSDINGHGAVTTTTTSDVRDAEPKAE